ncbi:putative quinol monooxygenase [Hirschia maritima]|uniref:putative quinol monooxygenase n=1 Tax=Hirschia maritima TaxID=1121961 RepID=UPI00036987D1|nr:antibiotic biosynthesis monooxygenase [Hirschia maritima]
MSIWVTLKMTVRDGAFEELTAFLNANLSNVRGFDGALQVNLFYDSATRAFLLKEEWASQRHHQAYMAFIQEAGVMTALLAFMEGEPVVTYYERLMM